MMLILFRSRLATDVKHVAAKNPGRAKWYEYYNLEVAEIVRVSDFRRAGAAS